MRNTLQTLTEVRHARYVMGTVVEIMAWADPGEVDNDTAHRIVYAGMAEFERLEKMFSRFDPDSELSRVNRLAAQQPVIVSKEFFTVIASGLEYAKRSAGCFSLQLAPLGKLWKDCMAENRLPSDHELGEARELSEVSLIKLGKGEHSIRFLAPGVGLDLGGLVKGYAADRVIELLKRAGLKRAVVNAGTSSIAVFDLMAKEDWAQVAVRDPRHNLRIVGMINLTSHALATSGTSEQQFRISGRTFSHLIDPRTGWPLKGCLSATTLCASAGLADIVAKLLLFLGMRRTLNLCDRCGWRIQALTMCADEKNHSLRVRHTDELNFTPIPSVNEEGAGR